MNPDVHHMALTAERELLPARAERGWLAAEARATARRRRDTGRVRRHVGAVLIHLGQRLQGASRLPNRPNQGKGLPALTALEP